MFRKIKEFRQRTMLQYQQSLEDEMEPWKKKIYQMHEEANFLFYIDEIELEKDRKKLWIRGEHIKGEIPLGKKLFLYDGEGKKLGDVKILVSPYEKEEKRKGLIRQKRNECCVQFLSLMDHDISAIDSKNYSRYMRSLQMELSMMSDYIFP